MTTKAFAPATLGSLSLANRIVMAPMTRCRAVGNVPNALMAEYYAQRASAGLIITEGTAPSANALGYARIPGLFNREQAAGWRLITDAVHEQGGRIFLQIMHTGRVSHALNMPAGAEVVAPSAVAAAGQMWTDQQQMQPLPVPRALTTDEVGHVVKEFAASARLAVDAGFDGIELHGANGYLIEQFLNPTSNVRTDQYGGSVENRVRFAVEVTRAVVDAIGADRTAIRLSPWGTFNDMANYAEIDETYANLAAELQKLGIAYVHVVNAARLGGPASAAKTNLTIRQTFTGTVIVCGAYHDTSDIAAALDGPADLVAIARPYVSNPDLVHRLQEGLALSTPEPSTFYAPGPTGFAEGYTDYAAVQSA